MAPAKAFRNKNIGKPSPFKKKRAVSAAKTFKKPYSAEGHACKECTSGVLKPAKAHAYTNAMENSDMFISPNLRSVQSVPTGSLKPQARKDVLAIKNYIRIRKWEYASYDSIMEQSKQSGVMVKKLLLDSDLDIVGEKGRPMVVLYQYQNQVGAYVLSALMSPRLGRLSVDTLKLLPPSVV